MWRLAPLIVLLSLLCVLPATAREYVLDLADGDATFLVEPGSEVSLKVIHRLPAGRYAFDVRRAGLLSPLDYDPESVAVDRALAISAPCEKLLDELKAAGQGNSESDLRAALIDAKSRSDEACLPRINEFEDGTEAELSDKIVVGDGQTLTLVVNRLEPEPARTWTHTFTTGEDRGWVVHYGFSFLPDGDDEFFTRATEGTDGTDGGFTIVRSTDRSGAEFEPTIAFTYLPKFSARKAYIPRFTAGLGADIDEQLVFAGLSWVIGDNVNIFLGAAGHEQSRLKGIYEEGQLLGEMLSGDQLVDKTFELNAIIGVGFRFGKNPFKKAAAQVASGQDTVDQDDEERAPRVSPGGNGAEGNSGAEDPNANGAGAG